MKFSETEEHTHVTPPDDLGDFTVTPRLIPISIAAMMIGAIASVVALALLKLIGLFTNLFYFQRWSAELAFLKRSSRFC